ncbi:hypothetical protein, partial [Streptococcus suis]
LSVTNLSHSKFYLISLSQSNFQFLRQTRTYFGNLPGVIDHDKFIKMLYIGDYLVYNIVCV